MSFYSYKNANAQCPGVADGSILTGLNQRVCVQVKNVYDSCLQQQQLDNRNVVVSNIVPVLPGEGCSPTSSKPCACTCRDNRCTCTCPTCGTGITHEEAVENAENSPCQLPQPFGAWTFESCRSSTTAGTITKLNIERLCDRPQYARVRCTVEVPVDVLFIDQRCQEWMGQTTLTVDRDVLLCIPDESIIPFTLESLVSAICVSGAYIGACTFKITICVTVVLKVIAEVDIMVPTYGFCEVPPAEEYAENVCDEFFSLPLFPQSSCAFKCADGSSPGEASTASAGTSTAASAVGGNYTCGSVNPVHTGTCGCSNSGGSCGCGRTRTCSNCGTTCASATGSLCPRCGCAMSSTT